MFINVTLRYILALVIIALLAMVANQILKYAVVSQDSYASIINVSGRQRMLSQRIAMLSHQLVEERNLSSYSRVKSMLLDNISTMEVAHKYC